MGLNPELVLDLPEAWFVIDTDPASRQSALTRDVAAWSAAKPGRTAHRDELMGVLGGFGEEADDQGALFAAAFWEPGEHGATVANLMVLRGSRASPGDIGAEVATLPELLARPDPGDHGDRDVTTVRLPVGPAARVRLLTSSPEPGIAPSLILDVTQLWIPLPHEPRMAVVSGSTPCLDVGDEVADIVDAVGTSLRFKEG